MGSLTKATTETFGQGGVNSTNIQNDSITNAKIASDAAIANSKLDITFPTISSLSITNGQPAVYDTETVDINGTDFTNGARVDFIHSTNNAVLNLPTVTFVSATQLRVTVPASTLTEGTDYKVRVSNPDGLAATSTGTVLYSQSVSFSTASGSLGSVGEGESASFSVSASSNSTIAYSVTSGSLPSGLSLNSSTGAITGTAPTVSADTVSSFTITATDAESQTASRSFSITVTKYVISNSLVFNDDDNAYMTRSTGTTNKRTFTVSVWAKRTTPGARQTIWASDNNTNDTGDGTKGGSGNYISFWNNGAFMFGGFGGSFQIRGDGLQRDPAAWYHIVAQTDTTQATTNDRGKLWINGVQQTTYTSMIGQNTDVKWATNRIGVRSDQNNYSDPTFFTAYMDGYLAELHVVDGQALTASDFGETDSTTGAWVPKKYTGTYGTDGYYLDFSNSSDLGNDSSGNNNDFTPSNLASADQKTDSPNNNFATFTPLNGYNQTLTEGNTRVTASTGSAASGLSTLAPTSGKWYIEYDNSRQQNAQLGVYSLDEYTHGTDTNPFPVGKAAAITIEAGANYSIDWDEDSSGGTLLQNSTNLNEAVYGMAVDIDNGNVYFSANGNWYSSVSGAFDKSNFSDATAVFSALPTTGDVPIAVMCRGSYDVGSGFGHMNFGNPPPQFPMSSSESDENGYGSFEYAPPSGYLALCTNNLPNVAIADPTAYFNTVLYTGNSSNRSITGVGFQPDFTWIKARGEVKDHRAFDSTRGATKVLYPSLTNAEGTTATSLTSFDSDGFSVGTSDGINKNTITYASWNWLVNGGTTSSNTDGDLTSTVQANTTAGFSIVQFTKTGDDQTVGHGLGKKPKLIITKPTNTSGNWVVLPEIDGVMSNKYLVLNATDALGTDGSYAEPTSSVFSVSNQIAGNNTFIAYCFAEIEGYSKFGNYTGNGSTNGTFVYTGFRPAFIMVKKYNNTGDWHLVDNKRNGYNPDNDVLLANKSDGEFDVTQYDILSNGFKLRSNAASSNASNDNYIYMAFAEAPIKYGTGTTSVEGTAR